MGIKFLKKIKRFCRNAYIKLYGNTHSIENKIVFDSFYGEQYSDNPRAISEKMHELYPEYKIVWRFKEGYAQKEFIPSYVKIVEYFSLQSLRECATAKCIIANNAQMMGFPKRNGQLILRTWHGDRGMKKIANEKESDKEKWTNTDNVDLFTAGSTYGVQRIRDAFSYQGEIICSGCPRNDCLINVDEDRIAAIKKRIGLPMDGKVVLYAPTFRDGQTSKQECEVDLISVLQHLNMKGEKWSCLTRSHHISKGLENISQCIDVTWYPDMADMLLISDMLITDYSSSSGDFILKNKPVILTHFDLEEYTKNYRSFRFDPETAGYFCVKNNVELLDLIDSLTQEKAHEECQKLMDFFGVCESGIASEIVCHRIADMNSGI